MIIFTGSASTGSNKGEVLVTQLLVPAVVERGTDVTLECGYQLAENQLYSIKWYHDDREFFR